MAIMGSCLSKSHSVNHKVGQNIVFPVKWLNPEIRVNSKHILGLEASRKVKFELERTSVEVVEALVKGEPVIVAAVPS